MSNITERITIDQEICHGKPCIRGIRYPVEIILDLLSSGMSFEEIIEDYLAIETDDIKACLAYASKYMDIKTLSNVA